jgi:hypothetical protein
MVDPGDQVARNTVSEFLSKMHVAWICISQPDFEHFRDKKLFDLASAATAVQWAAPSELIYLTASSAPTAELNSPSAKTMDDVISNAINAGASDLHF